MYKIKDHLMTADINLSHGKLGLVRRELGSIIRSPNLVPQPGQSHESVWRHTVSTLLENQRIYGNYPPIVSGLDYSTTMAGVLIHDIPEGFTPHGDLNYANSGHNSVDIRRAKELAEYDAAHHFVERNVLGQGSKKRFHSFIDEWVVLSSPLALYVRLLDMVDGNKSVIQKAMDLRRGVIQKIYEEGNIKEWTVPEAGAHISKIASAKTFPVVEALIHRLKSKEASLSILDWFRKGMMTSYIEAGWGYLPAINEMQRFLDAELKGYDL